MFSIGQLSKQTGVKIPTIRYYEQMGIIAAPERSISNQRRYTQTELNQLAFIKHARDLGLSIKDISELLKLSSKPEASCHNAHLIATKHLNSIKSRIKRLKKLEKQLKQIISVSDDGNIDNCHIILSLSDHNLCDSEH